MTFTRILHFTKSSVRKRARFLWFAVFTFISLTLKCISLRAIQTKHHLF